MKKICLKIHRWLAIPFGVFIFIICITGAILVYQTEIQKALNSDLYHVEVPSGTQMLPDKELAAKIIDQLDEGQSITFIQLSDEEGATAQVNIAGMGQKNLFVNPYTGEVLGYPRYTEFFDGVKSLHRWLFNKPENHQQGTLSAGRIIVGISAIAMSLILITGIIIWWPKNRKMLKARLKVRTGKGFRWFAYDSHVSLGIYAAVFLLLMSLTGPTWSFQWYKSGAQAVVGTSDDFRVDVKKHDGKNVMEFRHQDTQAQVWKQNPEDVNVMHISQNQQQKSGGFHMLMSSLHMGRWAGWFPKLIYLIAAVIGATLPLSGYYMWYKRTQLQRKAKNIKPKEQNGQ